MQALKIKNRPQKVYRAVVGLTLALFAVGFTINFYNQTSDAASLANWQAGRIMDDVAMINSSTMTAAQIQSFLNSKVPTCDTNGSQPSEMNNAGVPDYNGDGTIERWEWGKYHYNQTVFTCLKDYSENGLSAAQIIYNASQQYSINPQVLLVLLQKEQGLVTDTWPLNIQYQSATGYGCPDNSVCNSQYYGLTNQVTWSAKMFRAIEDNNPNWYTPYILGNNYIQYNPNSSCGGTTVNVQNRATQALYNYTPYQPNQAALNAGYGSGDSCSSYGNRNFFLYFTDWFGSTYTSIPYAWRPISQASYTDNTLSTQLNDGSIVAPGQKIYLQVKAQNLGYQNWDNTIVHLGTSNPTDRSSVFADTSWLSAARIGMTESTVTPTGTGTFTFSITAPQTPGRYQEYFNLVADGITWMNDPGMYFTIDVIPKAPTPSGQTLLTAGQQVNANDHILSADGHSILSLQRDGNIVIYSDFTPRWSSGTAGVQNPVKLVMQGDGNLVEYNAAGQATWNSQTSGNSGAYASLQTDGNLVVYSSSGSPLWNSGSVVVPDYLSRVSTNLPLNATLYPGQSLQTMDRKHKLVLQADGNLVLYSSASSSETPIWASGTNGQSALGLVMQSDGNLVLYSTSGTALWSSGTDHKSSSFLTVQPDGNLVMYAPSGQPIWWTGTAGR